MNLEIIYQDDNLVAINKPHGLLVHRSPIARDVSEFAVQLLRDQLDTYVYPVHRLDRKTGGVLLFTTDPDLNGQVQQLFEKGEVDKTYLAIVRGYTEDYGTIDYPLRNEKGKLQDAVTNYKTLDRCELAVPFGKFKTSRYSLLQLKPVTGRMHQIRKHMAHILHPIIADRPHGCNKQNRLFKDKWGMDTMMLHAESLSIIHPKSKQTLVIKARLQEEFIRMIHLMRFSYFINKNEDAH